MEAIRCEGLSKRYKEVEALKSLDLLVETGSVFGFLGRNGAGKTTTIRLLTGLAQPTSGTTWVAGVKTSDGKNAGKHAFGYLPEVPAFYTWMTPLEFLNYVGQLFSVSKEDRQRRSLELLELTGLAESSKRRIAGFSRGMRQRLGLAQALYHRPPVLFLDEPTSALDPAGRRAVLDLIDRLRGETTIFLSSHILEDVEKVCDTVGVIQEGTLLMVSGRDELLAQYPTNIVEMEFEDAEQYALEQLITQLRQQSWVGDISRVENGLRITVSDVKSAKIGLLGIVVEQKLPVERYEWVRPSLEEIFLTLST